MSEMTLKEVRIEINKLREMERKLEREERDQHNVVAQKFVGKCYKYKDQFLKIIDVPRTCSTKTGIIYNKYQFPAVFLQYPDKPKNTYIHDTLEEFVPCYCDTVYLDVGHGTPGCSTWKECKNYQEISQEEFAAEFDKCMESFKEQIGISKPKPMVNKYTCKYVYRTFEDLDGPQYWCNLYHKDCDNCQKD